MTTHSNNGDSATPPATPPATPGVTLPGITVPQPEWQPTIDDLRLDRYSLRTRALTASALFACTCSLWLLMAPGRDQQLDRLADRDPGPVLIQGATPNPSEANEEAPSDDAGLPMELILAGLSITLVAIGMIVRAATTDIYEEILDECRGEEKRIDRRSRRRRLRHRPTTVRLQRTARILDNTPKRLGNQLGVQTSAFALQRARRAAMRPLSEGTWWTLKQVKKFTKTDIPTVFDPRILTEDGALAHVTALREQASQNDPERPIRALRANRAAQRLQDLTGETVQIPLTQSYGLVKASYSDAPVSSDESEATS